MPHIIELDPQSNIAYMRIIGLLDFEDMTCDEELGLNDRPTFIFLDVSQMDTGLPEDFLDGARISFFTHTNMIHLALYSKSTVLDMIATMVSKITHREEKMSIHKTIQAATDYILELRNTLLAVR